MSNYSYFASSTNGLYRCANWHYDDSVPVWEHVGQTIAIKEFSLDLNNPDDFQACHSGEAIYIRRPSYYGDENWHEVFTKTDAENILQDDQEDFGWVEINSATGKEGYVYTRSREPHGHPNDDLMRLFGSADYGLTWLRVGNPEKRPVIYDVGGIWASRSDPDVMYALVNGAMGGTCYARYSTDGGANWAGKGSSLGSSVWLSRILIDPTDATISFAGKETNAPDLARATTTSGGYGTVQADAGIGVYYGYGGGWISATLNTHIRTVQSSRMYYSDTGGDSGSWSSNGVSNVGYKASFERAMWGDDRRPHWVGVASRTSIDEPTTNYHVLKSTQDNGGTWYDKAGANADASDGGGDSIPYDCGGVAENGLYLTVPKYVLTSVVAMRALPTGATVYADGVQMGALPTGATVYAHGVEQENPRS